MGLSRTVSETNGDFSRKSPNFSHRRVFIAPQKGAPWNSVSALAVKKPEWWDYQVVEKVLR